MKGGQCRVKQCVYKATVTPNDGLTPEETYTGMTKNELKERHRGHRKSFIHENYSTDTSLSIHVWALKDKMIDYAIKWEIIDRAPISNPVTRVCCLCVLEKYYIIFNPLGASLNKNNEVYKSCPHKRFMLLDKT